MTQWVSAWVNHSTTGLSRTAGAAPWDENVRIDPVDLHRRIRERLWALSDPALPANERIAALTVTDRVVGSGVMGVGNPLFDASSKTPYSHASQEAVEALIRHPQARLRYYQQVSARTRVLPS